MTGSTCVWKTSLVIVARPGGTWATFHRVGRGDAGVSKFFPPLNFVPEIVRNLQSLNFFVAHHANSLPLL